MQIAQSPLVFSDPLFLSIYLSLSFITLISSFLNIQCLHRDESFYWSTSTGVSIRRSP